jgi:glycosyltransferase involved in cell wall biosynthesis
MSGKKILQVVKTFDGALWAVQQVRELVKLGWEVHVIAPQLKGRYLEVWKNTGATLHELSCEFPVTRPWRLTAIKEKLKKFVTELSPDIIHSHFVSTTLVLRYALRDVPIPRIFQVPGPLHLESQIFGQWETMWSDANDCWIASSEYIGKLYVDRYGIKPERVFLSYYGTDLPEVETAQNTSERVKFGIPEDAVVFGNVSFIYPPKYYLGQKVGLKGHELMIDGLSVLMEMNPKLWCVFVGQQWGQSQKYYEKIKRKALKRSNRFIFTGYLPQNEILSIWKSFDFAITLPSSENCGGVIEPMLNAIPTLASNTGGLPEVVLDQKTGYIVKERSVASIVTCAQAALSEPTKSREFAMAGKKLVETMFNIERTAKEIGQIYQYILGTSKQRPLFDSSKIVGK